MKAIAQVSGVAETGIAETVAETVSVGESSVVQEGGGVGSDDGGLGGDGDGGGDGGVGEERGVVVGGHGDGDTDDRPVGWVVDEDVVVVEDGGVAVDHGGVTPLALQGGVGGQVGLAGGDHLGGVLDGLGSDSGENYGEGLTLY